MPGTPSSTKDKDFLRKVAEKPDAGLKAFRKLLAKTLITRKLSAMRFSYWIVDKVMHLIRGLTHCYTE